MPWLDVARPVRMSRVALVAPAGSLRDMLVRVAAASAVQIDRADADQDAPGAAVRAAPAKAASPALSAEPPDLDALRQAGRDDLLAGEAQLEGYAAAAVPGPGAAALAAWVPADRLAELAGQLAEAGCAVVPLRHPPGAQPPTLIGGTQLRRSVSPLVSTYGTVPYADIDPTWLAWASYVVMFGIMFGDAGQGLLLIAAAAALRAGWPGWARRFRRAWPFVGGAGLAATAFGLLYGEFFGPTGVVPTVWLAPLSHPIPLLAAGIGFGAFLLAGAYALGTVNRWREGGWPLALYAPSGIAGSLLFLGVGLVAGGWYLHHGALTLAGLVLMALALALAFIGFAAEAGGGGTGAVQVSVELFDLVVRLGSNLVSFARLAAFGLTHAALALIVWEGTRALWDRGGVLLGAAIAVFVLGNALTFALEALVAAIQALRLEYYELFSRVFVAQGRPFRPWYLPTETGEDAIMTGAQAPRKEVA